MNNRGRGIDQYPDEVRLQHGCPKRLLMKAAGSVASITIVIDVSFANKAAKLKVLNKLCVVSSQMLYLPILLILIQFDPSEKLQQQQQQYHRNHHFY